MKGRHFGTFGVCLFGLWVLVFFPISGARPPGKVSSKIFALPAALESPSSNRELEVPTPTDRAHDLAKSASKVEAETCEDVSNAQDCHDNYPTGCTTSENPNYDAYLNFLKNQTPAPDPRPVSVLTGEDFKTLEEKVPKTLTKRNHAKHAEQLADLGEGNIFAVVGYLYYAQQTGPESCNCKLSGPKNTDFHIGIGFDRDLAGRLRGDETVDKSELEQASYIVEMTPHYRAEFHPKWTVTRLKKVVGEQVKVVGQLMIDNEHAVPSQDCGRPNADHDKCWTASVWEIHPVTQFYVCKSESPCTADSNQWERIDDKN